MVKFRVKQRLADGVELRVGALCDSVEEAKEVILKDASCGSVKRREVAAAHIDDDGLFYAGWDYGIFSEAQGPDDARRRFD
jgi:hypothetical protein